jgi:hypothetical protein
VVVVSAYESRGEIDHGVASSRTQKLENAEADVNSGVHWVVYDQSVLGLVDLERGLVDLERVGLPGVNVGRAHRR